MIALFDQNTPQLMNDIRDSIARRSAADLGRAAHALLSSLGAFGAEKAHRLTLRLEALGRAGDFFGAGATFAELVGEADDVGKALRATGLSLSLPENLVFDGLAAAFQTDASRA
jgi:HPt (histidine-containing phosphotransfer) domain-containing protein